MMSFPKWWIFPYVKLPEATYDSMMQEIKLSFQSRSLFFDAWFSCGVIGCIWTCLAHCHMSHCLIISCRFQDSCQFCPGNWKGHCLATSSNSNTLNKTVAMFHNLEDPQWMVEYHVSAMNPGIKCPNLNHSLAAVHAI